MNPKERLEYIKKIGPIVDSLVEQGLNLDYVDSFYVDNWANTIHFSHFMFADIDAKRVEAIRTCKGIFGPLIAKGEPPSVNLEGTLDLNGITAVYELQGAFKCEITEYREVELTEEERAENVIRLEQAAKAVTALTKKKPIYSCDPVRPKVRGESHGGF